MSLEKLSQKNCNHQCKHSTVYLTYFTKGYVQYQCEKCGKSYRDRYTVKKTLGQGSISMYSRSEKGKLYLQWYTVSDASGYQIRYSKKGNMKNSKTINVKGQSKNKKMIKKLSRRKKYYVQVRAYKKSGTKTVYGKWSSKKCLKTK